MPRARMKKGYGGGGGRLKILVRNAKLTVCGGRAAHESALRNVYSVQQQQYFLKDVIPPGEMRICAP